MSHSDRASALDGQTMKAQARVSRLSHVYVARTDKTHTRGEQIDQLDGLMLSFASTQLPLDTLLGQVPCSKRAALDRVRRLTQLGLLALHRASDALPGTLEDTEAQEPEAPSEPAPATPHRVFRKPRLE